MYRKLFHCVELNEGTYYQQQKDSRRSIDFSYVQVVHIFAEWMTLDFKAIIFLNIKCLKNDTSYGHCY